METRITKLLGSKYPMIQGGMAWIAESTLASAVSNAGAVGLIAGGSAPIDYLRKQIRICKEKTQNPFGVNIMLMSPNADDLAQLVIDEKVPIVTTGAGNPGKYMEAWKNAGIKVIPVVPSVALAKRMERSGADALVAEGTESGGHIGMNTTMCLVPQVVDAVAEFLDMPVEDRGVGRDAEPVRRLVHSEPFGRRALLGTYPLPDPLVEYLRSSARYGVHPGLLELPQPLLRRQSRLADHVR